MSDDDAWRLPVAEPLDERRACLILARFGPEAKRVGQALAARLRADVPGRVVDGKIAGLPTLLHADQHPRRVVVRGEHRPARRVVVRRVP